MAFLRPGGALLVSDLKAEADGRQLVPAGHHEYVSHRHGLSEGRLRAAFAGAGLREFELRDAGREPLRHVKDAEGMEATWFVARGVKPV